MASIRIRVLDVSGSRARDVEAPDDVPANRIIALLVDKMALPLNSPDGQIMSYKLYLRRTGQQLLDGLTLADAAVIDGDELRLQPEITAGAIASASDSSMQTPLSLDQHRFARFELVEWWRQDRLRDARVLVVGAGALGNEVIKNLALLGIGHLVVADMDRVEISNLARSVLFREGDAGAYKAECAVRAAKDLYPSIRAHAIAANVLVDLGLGWIRWADIVVGALDNREARVFLNAACARLGRPWVDGGIEVLRGIARGFHAPGTACYECTMSEVDWRILNQRRSCSMLARRALAEGGVPTTPLTASVIGAIQAQEVVKYLHGMEALLGRGFVYEGTTHNSYAANYPISPDCPWHEGAPEVVAVSDLGPNPLLAEVWRRANELLGGCDAIDFARDIVDELECVDCGAKRSILRPIDAVDEDAARCDSCGGDSIPRFIHSIQRGNERLSMTAGEIGLPDWEIVWARKGDRFLGLELAAEASPPGGID